MAKPTPLAAYASSKEFYAARQDRFGYRECDYGCFWRWGTSRMPQYRVSYVYGSGEIYVMQFGGRASGRVEVYGHCPDFALLEQALAGWAAQCGRPRSLLWLLEQLKEHGLDRRRPPRLSALAA